MTDIWYDVLPYISPSIELPGEVVVRKILAHYWTREIGLETVGLWRDFMLTRLDEIMPKYIEMIRAQNEIGSIFDNTGYFESWDVDNQNRKEETNRKESNASAQKGNTRTDTKNLQTATSMDKSGSDKEERNLTSSTNRSDTGTDTWTETGTIGDTGQNKNDTTNTGTNKTLGSENRTIRTDETSKNQFSDTPQNGLSDVISGRYLTSANVDTLDHDTTNNLSIDTQTAVSGSTNSLQTINNTRTLNTSKADTKNLRTITSGTEGGSSTHTLTGHEGGTTSNTGTETITDAGTETLNDTTTNNMEGTAHEKEIGNRERKGFTGDKVRTMFDYSQMYVNIMQMIIGDVADLFMSVL